MATDLNMHLAIYVPSLRGGGAERAMVTLANGMAERGLRVDLVLASAEGPYLKEVAPGVRVVSLGARRVSSSLPGLVRYLRRERPQTILSVLNHANVIAVLAKMLSGVNTRLLVSERNNLSLSETAPQSWRAKTVLPLMRWAYPKADGIVAVSNGVADDLAQALTLPRERISVVYNPVVTQELLDKALAPLEHPWLEHSKPPVILAVGRLTKQKDLPSLIRAFAKVRSQLDCRLVILGEGELRLQLETLIQELGIQDSVQLPGFADNPFAWMSRVSLFVLSSAWEGLPNALIQAMACGAAVVSTDCPSGPAEILERGKWGALVPVGDVDALADSMLETLRSPASLNVTMRAKDFDSTVIVEQYIKILCASNAEINS
jgi:glycosyltransferase involved in cell wall biosynthesis